MATIDLIIIAIYMAVTIAIGLACRGRQSTVDDYFTARGEMSGRFASILVGLSIAATLFSGISFVAYPGVVYSHGIAILLGLLGFPIAWLVLRLWFLPRYLGRTSARQHPYDVLEERFGPRVRTLAATMYVLLRIGWMALLLYAPAIMLLTATRLDSAWLWPVVLTIGMTCTFYTAVGGIRGVIVTDAIQFVAIIGGLAATTGYILWHLDAPVREIVDMLGARGSLELLDFSLDPTNSFTVWAILIGATLANLSGYVADQMSLQRYLAIGSVRAASRAFAINVIGVMAVLLTLAVMGLALVAWYHYHPDPTLPAEAELALPHFIATQLPAGVAGLLLAALLAATMSSMTSGINTLAGTLTLDFRQRLGGAQTASQQLRFARWCSVMIGVTATCCAGVVGNLGTVFEIAERLLGVFFGPLLACMILALTAARLDRRAVFFAMLIGSASGWLTALSTAGVLWTAPITFLVTLLVAGLGSLLLNTRRTLADRTAAQIADIETSDLEE